MASQTNTEATTSTVVSATIKISICGNGIVEGGEDCDGTNVQGKTCQSLGYSGGSLSCDISCSFNTSSCIVATPTPTPAAASSASSTQSNSTSNSIVNPTLFPILTAVPVRNSLPVFLQPFANSQGRIEIKTLYDTIHVWVTEWDKAQVSDKKTNTRNKRQCDLNNDGVCDIKDLSILLFYVQK